MPSTQFTKVKALHLRLESELDRLSKKLTDKYKREIVITVTSDGLCVMFKDQDMTGITLDEFERLSKAPGFDTRDIVTCL